MFNAERVGIGDFMLEWVWQKSSRSKQNSYFKI